MMQLVDSKLIAAARPRFYLNLRILKCTALILCLLGQLKNDINFFNYDNE